MRKYLMALAAALLFLPLLAKEPVQRDSVKAVWTEVDGVDIPLPPMEHPRLYVRTSDIPALKEKMKSPQGRKGILGVWNELPECGHQKARPCKREGSLEG